MWQSYGSWTEKKYSEKNCSLEKAPISMLKSAEDKDLGTEYNSRYKNRHQLVRRVSDSDEEREKHVTSSRLLSELQRFNTSYSPGAR